MTADRPIADFVPPTVPQHLHVVNASPNSMEVMWDAATDNVGVAGYELSCRKDGDESLTSVKTEEPGATLDSLSPATQYTLRVRAYDAVGNRSFWSAPLSAKTS